MTQGLQDALDAALFRVNVEVTRASDTHPPFNSAHEGFAVLAEEVDELWDHVKVREDKRDVDAMRREAVQVAAMAIRFVVDICRLASDGARP